MKRSSRRPHSEFGEIEKTLATETRRVKLFERMLFGSVGLAATETVLYKADTLSPVMFDGALLSTIALGGLSLVYAIKSAVREDQALVKREMLIRDLSLAPPDPDFLGTLGVHAEQLLRDLDPE